MEKNTEILQFLEGSLSHEAEAELLHRLSVSPERRDVLRSYIDQRVLFQRDREAINVPYAAEQKLWSRLAEIMPAVPAATIPSGTATVMTATRGLRWFSVASIGAVCVILGLLSGFYLGRNAGSETATVTIPQSILTVEEPVAQATTTTTSEHMRTAEQPAGTRRYRSEAPQASTPVLTDQTTINTAAPVVVDNAQQVNLGFAAVAVRTEQQTAYVHEPRESHSLAELIETTQQIEQSVYPMELSFAESFGMQFPADAKSRNTQPLITNSTITGMYQLYHGNIELWVGASIGSANLAKIALSEDPQPGGGSELAADISHMQTTWVGPIAQLRHRFTEHISANVSAGGGYSELGTLFYGEVGGRYDLTDQVGITVGFRSLHLPYDLSQEQMDVLQNAVYPIDAGGDNYGSQWSHNFEFLTGMYFRF